MATTTCMMTSFLFKPKANRPQEIIRSMHNCLATLESCDEKDLKSAEKAQEELMKLLLEMKAALLSDANEEPSYEVMVDITYGMLNDRFLHSFIRCLPLMSLEARMEATHVLCKLQWNQIDGRHIVVEYMEENTDLIDLLVSGFENKDSALFCGRILRECFHHTALASYALQSTSIMSRFFSYIDLPNFDVAADALLTLKELMTRHKTLVALYLSKNFAWFFHHFGQLLSSSRYITKRQAIQFLGDLLLDPAYAGIMMAYVNTASNLRVIMNLLKEPSKSIQVEAFHIFKAFVANERKSEEVKRILVSNKDKLLEFLVDFNTDNDNPNFAEDKDEVLNEIRKWKPLTN
ncbi:hypothetical protein CBR_g9148 [Chara braunii]|uniref:Mo25-like protein n=1 Tax=Chara braunii TaxID=69332 RepID=A0A388KP05_CHABU|nr:hypothetical protein CBR_g9148 [Chara braunii]|eukprot:GBG71738.1 hypothetical protein CBR_g9148 [Chara braunii]